MKKLQKLVSCHRQQSMPKNQDNLAQPQTRTVL